MGQVIIEHFFSFFLATYLVIGALVLWTAKTNREYIHKTIERAVRVNKEIHDAVGHPPIEALFAGPSQTLFVALLWPSALFVLALMLWLIWKEERYLKDGDALTVFDRPDQVAGFEGLAEEMAHETVRELFAPFEAGEVAWFEDFVSKVKPCFNVEWVEQTQTVVYGAGSAPLSSVSMMLHREVLLSSAGEGVITSLVAMVVRNGEAHCAIVCKMREDSPVDGDDEAPEGRYRWMAYEIDSTFKDADFIWTTVINPMLIALNGEDESDDVDECESDESDDSSAGIG